MNIKATAKSAIIDEVAVNLKRYYKVFADGAEPPAQKDEEAAFGKMASDLINTGQFEVTDGAVVNLDKLKKKLDDISELSPEAKELVSKVRVIDDIPDAEATEEISAAIDRGVKKSTGLFNSMSGFLSTIANFLSAIVEWIGEMVGGGDSKRGFWEILGDKTADSVSVSVHSELSQLKAQKPELNGLLTDERMSTINQTVRAQTMAEATGKAVPVKQLLSDVQMIEVGEFDDASIKQKVLEGVTQTIGEKFAVDDKGTGQYDPGVARASAEKGWGMREHHIQELQKAFADTATQLVKNTDTKGLSDEKLRELMAKGVTDSIKWSDAGEETVRQNIMKNDGDPKDIAIDHKTLDKLRLSSDLYNNGIDVAEDAPVLQSTPGNAVANHVAEGRN